MTKMKTKNQLAETIAVSISSTNYIKNMNSIQYLARLLANSPIKSTKTKIEQAENDRIISNKYSSVFYKKAVLKQKVSKKEIKDILMVVEFEKLEKMLKKMLENMK